MRIVTVVFGGAAFLALSWPGAARGQGEPAELVGCWSLQVGTWDPALEGSRAPAFPPPRSIEIRGRPGADEGRAVYHDGEEFWSGRRWRHWKWSEQRGGGVAIIFSTGFSGYRLRLDPAGEGLEGTIEGFTDIGGRSRAPVTARRTACPKPVG